jgi:hypothetical protein
MYIESADVNNSDSSTQTKVFKGITDGDVSVVSPFQEYLLLGIFIVSFEMNQAPPNGSCFIGFKCTNQDCLRIFPVLSALSRHKNHPSSRNTDCAKSKFAEKLYEVNENRAGSLQTSKIVAIPLSGNVQTACTFAPRRETARILRILQKDRVNNV